MNSPRPNSPKEYPEQLQTALERLEAGVKARLLLLTGAESQKTNSILGRLANALECQDIQTAWITMNEEDNNPHTFLTHLADAAGSACARLQLELSPMSDPLDEMDRLINSLSELPQELVLGLIGFDTLHEPLVLSLTAHLIDYLPPQVHLLIAASRPPPGLPLARLRVRRQITEVHAEEAN